MIYNTKCTIKTAIERRHTLQSPKIRILPTQRMTDRRSQIQLMVQQLKIANIKVNYLYFLSISGTETFII